MTYKQEFIKFMQSAGVLTFGDFTAKSGRKTPYFINTGNYKTGEHIARLGEFYADAMRERGLGDGCDVLFGPAYKGIPLCVAASIAYYKKYGKSLKYSFNRKEEKDHGEGGSFVGHRPGDGDRVLIIEDVITAGTAMRETMPLLRAAGVVAVTGVLISVDRMERGTGDISAIRQVKNDYGIEVYSIVTSLDIMECMEDGVIEGREYLEKMREYRAEYGV